jgi:hypothetical protein
MGRVGPNVLHKLTRAPGRNGRHERIWRGLLLVVPLMIAFAYWFINPTILIDADSPRYLAGDSMRTATYPLFLKAMPSPVLLPAQLMLFALSLAWLGFYTSKYVGLPMATGMAGLSALNPYVWQLQATIMTESLTTPLLVVFTGLLVGFAATGKRGPILLAAVIVGIGASIRPSLLLLLVGPLSLVWLGQRMRSRISQTLMILLLCAAPIAAERLYSKSIHGDDLHSPLGLLLFMKSAVVDAPPTIAKGQGAFEKRTAEFLNRDYEPVRRLIAEAPDRNIRYILLSSYEACAAYTCGEESVFKHFPMREAERYRRLGAIGVQRLRSNPFGYFSLTLSELHRMWLLHPRKQQDLAKDYNRYLATNSPLPFQSYLAEYGQPTPQSDQRSLYGIQRIGFAAIGLVSAILAAALIFFRGNPIARAGLAVLLSAQAVLIFTAMVALGLPRYAMGVWPLIASGLVLGSAGIATSRLPQAMRSGGKVPFC